jgi:hypothetical protein
MALTKIQPLLHKHLAQKKVAMPIYVTASKQKTHPIVMAAIINLVSG